MKQKTKFTLLICMLMVFTFKSVIATPPTNEAQDSVQCKSDNKLVVVWTSADKEVAMKMVFMYTYNAQKYKWWDDITLLIWGPSGKLLTEDEDLQNYLKKIIESGTEVLACKGCSDQYEISEKLEELGVTVRYTGGDLTSFIKERHVITF